MDAGALAAGGQDAAPPHAASLYHVALIEGRLAPFTGDYRLALLRLDALVTALRAAIPSAVSVEATRRPLDVSPAASVSGDAAQSDVEAFYAVRIAVDADG
jgi:hypothetical protein